MNATGFAINWFRDRIRERRRPAVTLVAAVTTITTTTAPHMPRPN